MKALLSNWTTTIIHPLFKSCIRFIYLCHSSQLPHIYPANQALRLPWKPTSSVVICEGCYLHGWRDPGGDWVSLSSFNYTSGDSETERERKNCGWGWRDWLGGCAWDFGWCRLSQDHVLRNFQHFSEIRTVLQNWLVIPAALAESFRSESVTVTRLCFLFLPTSSWRQLQCIGDVPTCNSNA